jgi:hypothetical protein
MSVDRTIPPKIRPGVVPSFGMMTASRSAPFSTANTRIPAHIAIALSAIAKSIDLPCSGNVAFSREPSESD